MKYYMVDGVKHCENCVPKCVCGAPKGVLVQEHKPFDVDAFYKTLHRVESCCRFEP